MINSHSRLSDIELSDNQDKDFINYVFKQGFNEFNSIFMYFFNRYNSDGVLSVNEMRTMCNTQDFKLWQEYINKYEKRLLSNDSAKYRLQKAKATAGKDKQQLLSALSMIIIASTSLLVSDHLQGSMINEYRDAFTYKSLLSLKAGYKAHNDWSNNDINKEASELVNDKRYGANIDERIWMKSDILNGQINSAINAALTKGADNQYINNKLMNYIPSNRNESANASFTKTGTNIANVLVADNKAYMEDNATNQVFSIYNVEKFNYATQGDGKVCDPCIDRANSGPFTYATDEGSLHTGDRCYRVPVQNKY